MWRRSCVGIVSACLLLVLFVIGIVIVQPEVWWKVNLFGIVVGSTLYGLFRLRRMDA